MILAPTIGSHGGQVRFSRELVRALAMDERFTLHVVVRHSGRQARQSLLDHGVKATVLDLRLRPGKREQLRSVVDMARELRRYAPDVVHVPLGSLWIAAPGLLAGRRRAVIVTCHGDIAEVGPRIGRLERAGLALLLRRHDLVMLANTKSLLAPTLADLGVEAENGGVAVVGTDLDVPVEKVEARRWLEGEFAIGVDTEPLREPRVLVVNAATVSTVKDPDLFVDVALHSKEAGVRADFVWAGDGPELGRIRKRVEREGLGSMVHFVDHVDEVELLLGAADIYLSTSTNEGLPFGVVQAMAAGLALVVPAVGGLPDLVDHGRTGLVERRSVDDLGAALARLVSDVTERERLGRQAQSYVRANHSLQAMMASHVALIDALLDDEDPSHPSGVGQDGSSK